MDAKKITTVKEATYAVAKRRPEKSHAWRDSNPELCENRRALQRIELATHVPKQTVYYQLS